jgi:hypothetical protein
VGADEEPGHGEVRAGTRRSAIAAHAANFWDADLERLDLEHAVQRIVNELRDPFKRHNRDTETLLPSAIKMSPTFQSDDDVSNAPASTPSANRSS